MIWLFALISCGALIALDQLVKNWASEFLQPVGSMSLIEGFIKLTYVENRGAAFGLLEDARWLLVALPAVFAVAIVIYYARMPKEKVYWAARVPVIFILAGALGNFIDRARSGFVVDMFEFDFMSFPVFNVADICITCGAVSFALVTLFVIKDKEQPGVEE